MTQDKALTILLTLKDRPAFTSRWMSYANTVRLPFKVFIADGGSGDGGAAMLADHSAYPNVDYEYVRYPADQSYEHYYAKVADALTRIDTPYVVLADNDDLFLVSGLRSAVGFLMTHPDYATCGGQCAIFWMGRSGADDERDTRRSGIEWKCSLEGRSLTGDTASERVRQHSPRSSQSAYYNVARTALLAEQFRIVRESALDDLFLTERLILFLAAVAGKTKQLDTLYLARQWDSPGSTAAEHQAQHGDWFGRMLAPSWSRDFSRFVDATSRALAARDAVPVDEARRVVIMAYREWLAPQLLRDVLGEPTISSSMPLVVWITRRLLTFAPNHPLRQVARAIYRRTRWISLDALHGTQFRSRTVANAASEMTPILAFVGDR
jgi:glycosyltransferase domain-containing protein